jgi:hypothetical protein
MEGGFETVMAKVPMEVGERCEEMLVTMAAKMEATMFLTNSPIEGAVIYNDSTLATWK